MSNANTIRRQVSGNQQLTLASLSGTAITTTETAFQLNNNALTQSGGGVVPLSAGVTGLYQGTGQVLHIRIAGSYSGATANTTTLKIKVYQVPASLLPISSPTSFSGWTSILDSTAKTVTTATGSFTADAYVQLDAAGNLEGSYNATINGAAVVSPTVITPVTGLTGEADLNFVATATLGGAETGVIVTINEFALDYE